MSDAAPASDQAKGLLFGILGILIITPDALVIRLVGADPWSFMVWRGAFMAVGLLVLLSLRYHVRTPLAIWRIGWLGVLVGAAFAGVTMAFQFAISTTAVANVMVIISTAPLAAALLSWVLLRERTETHTWIAIVVCLLGMGMIFVGGVENPTYFGEICALVASVGLGLYFVLVRLGRPVDMAPAVMVGAIMMSLVSIPFAESLYLTPRQFQLTAMLALVILPLSFFFLSMAPRYLPAPEVGLIVLLETVIGPFWVWLVIGEVPAAQTIAGGFVILGTLAVHALVSMRRARRRSAAAPAGGAEAPRPVSAPRPAPWVSG